MKKIIKEIIVLIVLTIGMTSCSNSDVPQDNPSNLNYDTDFPAQTNPDIKQFEAEYPDFELGLNIASEQDYSNIICYTDCDNYSLDFEKIVITV